MKMPTLALGTRFRDEEAMKREKTKHKVHFKKESFKTFNYCNCQLKMAET